MAKKQKDNRTGEIEVTLDDIQSIDPKAAQLIRAIIAGSAPAGVMRLQYILNKNGILGIVNGDGSVTFEPFSFDREEYVKNRFEVMATGDHQRGGSHVILRKSKFVSRPQWQYMREFLIEILER